MLFRGCLQRALRQAGPWLGIVVGARRDVVRAVRVEQRRQVLDLPAARAELEHPAAVERDAVRLAVLVEGEQLSEETEARGLRVEGAGREYQLFDVRDRMDRCVPRDPLAVRLEH